MTDVLTNEQGRVHRAAMTAKSQYLQIRITPGEKARLKRLAAAAGQDVSSYVLARALPSVRGRFEELIDLLGTGEDHRYVLAELNDLLSVLGPGELREAVVHADLGRLTPLLQNYVAAMVEQACYQQGMSAPPWTSGVAPLESPHFGASLKSVRLHLLRAAPIPFKRRNIFVDATVGARV